MKKNIVFMLVGVLGFCVVELNAAAIYASNFERNIYDTSQCYLESYDGTTNLSNPDVFSNLLGESDSLELGWRVSTQTNGFVISFAQDLMDGAGADLIVRDFGPGAYSVFASAQDIDSEYVKIGDSSKGKPGVFNDYGFDFAGLNNVRYIKILRTSSAAANGRFFDSFQGKHAVPEPCTIGLLGLGSCCLLRRKKKSN